MSPETVLITGATLGIGYELAHLFAHAGHGLVLVARNEAKLAEVAQEIRSKYGVPVAVLPKDLAKSSASTELVDELKAAGLSVTILVNNAGFGGYGFFHEQDVDRQVDMVQVNVTALTELTRRLLPDMVAKKHGRILNVASTAAFQPGPLMAVYYATKAYVVSFSHALANELRRSGVTVTVLCPGPTTTAFQENAGMANSPLFERNVMDARTVAEAGFRGCLRGTVMVIPGWKNRLLTLATRLVPMRMTAKIARSIQETRRS